MRRAGADESRSFITSQVGLLTRDQASCRWRRFVAGVPTQPGPALFAGNTPAATSRPSAGPRHRSGESGTYTARSGAPHLTSTLPTWTWNGSTTSTATAKQTHVAQTALTPTVMGRLRAQASLSLGLHCSRRHDSGGRVMGGVRDGGAYWESGEVAPLPRAPAHDLKASSGTMAARAPCWIR